MSADVILGAGRRLSGAAGGMVASVAIGASGEAAAQIAQSLRSQYGDEFVELLKSVAGLI